MTQPRKSNIIPFNGAFYTKDGNLHNLDGASGQAANASDLAPFTGVFIGSDGAEHDITELLNLLGSGGEGEVKDVFVDGVTVLNPTDKIAYITLPEGEVRDVFVNGATVLNPDDKIAYITLPESDNIDDALRNKRTILMGDTTHFNISAVDITNAGSGYAVNDTITLTSNSITIVLTVAQVNDVGGITQINYPYIISETNFKSDPDEITPDATSGSGTGARFIIHTAYAIGNNFIYGFLGYVPDSDPLVQYTALIGYVNQIINQYFPVTTDNIADQAVTAAKIDDSAIYQGEGIVVTKDENGIRISAIPEDYQGITVTFINIDQNGDPV